MPGNLCDASGDQREIGSSPLTPPPRHCRMKAKAARVRGRIVSRRRSFEVKEGGEGRTEEE